MIMFIMYVLTLIAGIIFGFTLLENTKMKFGFIFLFLFLGIIFSGYTHYHEVSILRGTDVQHIQTHICFFEPVQTCGEIANSNTQTEYRNYINGDKPFYTYYIPYSIPHELGKNIASRFFLGLLVGSILGVFFESKK